MARKTPQTLPGKTSPEPEPIAEGAMLQLYRYLPLELALQVPYYREKIVRVEKGEKYYETFISTDADPIDVVMFMLEKIRPRLQKLRNFLVFNYMFDKCGDEYSGKYVRVIIDSKEFGKPELIVKLANVIRRGGRVIADDTEVLVDVPLYDDSYIRLAEELIGGKRPYILVTCKDD